VHSGFGLGCGKCAEASDDGGIDGSAVVEENADYLPNVFLLCLGCHW